MLNCIIATMRPNGGNEAAQHASLVHHAQDDVRIVRRSQQFDEDGIGFRIFEQCRG
jgi:hypothetical protein